MVWKWLFSSFLESYGFWKCKFFIRQQSLWRGRTAWHPKSLNDTSWWQCMFAHTHRRSLSLLLPWTSLQAASILLTFSTPSTLKNPCMCHSQEHSQKPRAVPFSKISPIKVSVCLYYEKPMEINTLSINIVYCCKYVFFIYFCT